MSLLWTFSLQGLQSFAGWITPSRDFKYQHWMSSDLILSANLRTGECVSLLGYAYHWFLGKTEQLFTSLVFFSCIPWCLYTFKEILPHFLYNRHSPEVNKNMFLICVLIPHHWKAGISLGKSLILSPHGLLCKMGIVRVLVMIKCAPCLTWPTLWFYKSLIFIHVVPVY